MSVQRAYTRMELRALLAGADLRPIGEVRAPFGHRVAIAAVPIREPAIRQAPRGGRGLNSHERRPRRRRRGRRRPRRAPRRPRTSRGPATRCCVLERAPAWHWRAGGVFASPAAVRELRRAGLDDATLARVARPIPAMRVESPRGTAFRLTYGAEAGGATAVGSTGRRSTRPCSTSRRPRARRPVRGRRPRRARSATAPARPARVSVAGDRADRGTGRRRRRRAAVDRGHGRGRRPGRRRWPTGSA